MWLLVCSIDKFWNAYPFDQRAIAGSGKVGPVNPLTPPVGGCSNFNWPSQVASATAVYIEPFVGVFVLSLCFFHLYCAIVSYNFTHYFVMHASVGKTKGPVSKHCWFESAVRHYFYSNNVRLFGIHLYRWRPTIRMTDAWRIKKSILVRNKILIFSLFVGYWYRKGSSLNQQFVFLGFITPHTATYDFWRHLLHFHFVGQQVQL